MDYRARRALACRQAFESFYPDFSGCRLQNGEAEKILDMARNGYFSKEIAKATGRSPKSILKFFRRYNFPALQNIEPPVREERPNWKGGTKLLKGYEYQSVPDHPNGTRHGNYVATHRLVMERELGRYLLPEEVVHHIDGDIRNNAPENLALFASNAEHLAETLKGRCPNWSADGRKALDHARRQRRRTWKGVPR